MPAELLEWDTAFFGFPIARVREPLLTPDAALRLDAWCAAQGVRCLYLLCRPDDPAAIRLAEQRGYHLVDLRVTLRWDAATALPNGLRPARAARPEDLPALQAIARESYHQTRFFNDPGFPRDRVQALYETWIRRSVEGWADAVLVAADEQGVAGYVTCHRQGSHIGLLGVSSRSRGEGLGRTLVGRALEWFRSQTAPEVLVSTQGANLAALRFYQRCGFSLHDLGLWYHKWYLL